MCVERKLDAISFTVTIVHVCIILTASLLHLIRYTLCTVYLPYHKNAKKKKNYSKIIFILKVPRGKWYCQNCHSKVPKSKRTSSHKKSTPSKTSRSDKDKNENTRDSESSDPPPSRLVPSKNQFLIKKGRQSIKRDSC